MGEIEADAAKQRRGHRESHGLRIGPCITKATRWRNRGEIGIGYLQPCAMACQPGMAIKKSRRLISAMER